ncbi:hypothetical protein [Pseudaminobacter soli (ex Li et al. 2025)]|uniref:Sulfur globule protein n=1 Tax=Pseudaminobacter soli (ex Li et al. 2025) TaxID=1295366 RepID=A0A2P7S179_9HYPH|nr:hypothetical protein [Mesorhizobium soli]PSJ56211.1 hypothetical protein C7I85_24825 [Mesorhizobium soli]
MERLMKIGVLAAAALLTMPLTATAQYEDQGGGYSNEGRMGDHPRHGEGFDERHHRHFRHGCHTEMTREWHHDHMVTKRVTVCNRPYDNE